MQQKAQMRVVLGAFASLGVLALGIGGAKADQFIIDLTHPMGTFEPTNGDISKPDLSKPHLDSIVIPTFGAQTVYEFNTDFKTNQGAFQLGRLVLSEHHGTHMDSPGHFITNEANTESPNPVRKQTHELTTADLIGPIVFIDLSSRVKAELDKNGGAPSPDKAVTDFSESSNNVVTSDDIDGIADKLVDGAWIVVNLGWSGFYSGDLGTSPYINGWNFPGIGRAGVDRLIEVEDQKGIRINGLLMDNIGIDSGESSRGVDDKWTNSWHAHVRGLQRGWKLVENATNLGQLAMAKPDSCTLVVGAPKHVRGGGGPSRVFAMCER